MISYLRGVLEDFPEEINGEARTPVADHLFQVRPDEERRQLCKRKAKAFHHAMAQLLFACSRARKDIQTAVAFLTTRVKAPDEDDWSKLVSVMRYLKGMLLMPLTL